MVVEIFITYDFNNNKIYYNAKGAFASQTEWGTVCEVFEFGILA